MSHNSHKLRLVPIQIRQELVRLRILDGHRTLGSYGVQKRSVILGELFAGCAIRSQDPNRSCFADEWCIQNRVDALRNNLVWVTQAILPFGSGHQNRFA